MNVPPSATWKKIGLIWSAAASSFLPFRDVCRRGKVDDHVIRLRTLSLFASVEFLFLMLAGFSLVSVRLIPVGQAHSWKRMSRDGERKR